jgi:hypothetical protein
MGHRCGSARPPNRNDGPAMRFCPAPEPQLWAIDAVPPGPRTATMGHRCGSARLPNRNDGAAMRFLGSEFWSTPQRGPGGAMSPAGPGPVLGQVSRHSGHSAQSAARLREAGALYVGKNNSEVPPPSEEDPQGPVSLPKNGTMGHQCGRRIPARVPVSRRYASIR